MHMPDATHMYFNTQVNIIARTDLHFAEFSVVVIYKYNT